MTIKQFTRIGIAAIAVATGLVALPATAADTLRVCADPDNLPFSSNAPSGEKGMYVELAELVAAKLGQPIEFVWWYTHNQRRALRNTIQKSECDATFALPANTDWRARGVQKSAAFLDVGYVVVAAQGTSITSLESLKGKRIALQFSSTPHILFSMMDGFTTTTHKEPDEIFAMLAKGETDVGILWGPVAGYANKTKHQNRWQITPVTGMDLSGQVVVGVRTGAEGLKARIDTALGELKPEIGKLAEKYGFPSSRAVSFEGSKPNSAVASTPKLASRRVVVPTQGWMLVSDTPEKPKKTADKKKAAAATAATAATATAAPAAATTAAVSADPLLVAGRTRFNDQCSHCHGADGASPVRERDVRRLVIRYDKDKWRDLAVTTIKNGRPDLGMPTWKDTLTEDNIKELMAFLTSIQK
jgi:polar amino acid transport system substrate-binding protein